VNGADWTDQLAAPDLVSAASRVASIPEVRDILTGKQREYAQTQTLIMEGRDIGSVVFPDAFWKFFVTASEEIRAKRMFKTLSPEEKVKAGDWQKMLPRVQEIDHNDRNRKVAPLRMAEDAWVYDNSLSPSADEDAAVLHYYVTHRDEILRNNALVQGRNVIPGALHGTGR
jgi:CMP/dCMP kinase